MLYVVLFTVLFGGLVGLSFWIILSRDRTAQRLALLFVGSNTAVALLLEALAWAARDWPLTP